MHAWSAMPPTRRRETEVRSARGLELPGMKMLSRTAVGAVAGILGGVGIAVVVTIALVIIRKPSRKSTP